MNKQSHCVDLSFKECHNCFEFTCESGDNFEGVKYKILSAVFAKMEQRPDGELHHMELDQLEEDDCCMSLNVSVHRKKTRSADKSDSD